MYKAPEPPRTIGNEERYILSSNAQVSFFSNKAQLPFKQAQAENNLRAFVYSEVLPLVDELLLIAPSAEVFELTGRIKHAMLQDKD